MAVRRDGSAVVCRLRRDEPADGAWNMALDEALLELADVDRIATLRFYSWSRPTLSLGYFQASADRAAHPASVGCGMVRRASGGGAILHHLELTYSLAIPTADRMASAARGLHDAVHAALCEALGSLDIAAQIVAARIAGGVQPERVEQPFLCFQRHAPGDIMLGDAKIAGSAQRRHRGAILQHGSVLLARSPFAPELPGIAELCGRRIDPRELADRFCDRLRSRLGLSYDHLGCAGAATCVDVERRAAAIAREKFAAAAWTGRR